MEKLKSDQYFKENNYAEIIVQIGNQNVEFKVEFIKHVLSQIEETKKSIWAAVTQSNVNKILFYDEFQPKYSREWILFESGKIYCVYCLCFSAFNSKNLFIDGSDCGRGSRIAQKLKTHDSAANHKAAVNRFCELENCDVNARKSVVRIITKIIIFLTTHG